MSLVQYYKLLRKKNVLSWCFFDFGLSSYPTLILTFFYGAYYAKNIANNYVIGTALWGYAISTASIICFLLFTFVLIYLRTYTRKISIIFFFFFGLLIIFSSSSLGFFDKGGNQYFPLIFIIISFISFEVLNFFYNISLKKVSKNGHEGFLSNIGWAFGYLGGLLSLMICLVFLTNTKGNNYQIFEISSFALIGPFVAIWILIFCFFHFKNFKREYFLIPTLVSLFKNFHNLKIKYFLFSYFFFNNGVVSVFAFASMFASFLYDFNESEILLLGVFINLSGVVGCIIFGFLEKSFSSEKAVLLCIVALLLLTSGLLIVENVIFFWFIALSIGFFIGPIQACSRSVLVKKLPIANQLGAFSIFSILGNICAILGPFLVGYTIHFYDSIKNGLAVIPFFFFISLIPFYKKFSA